jgi:hypothetical protein
MSVGIVVRYSREEGYIPALRDLDVSGSTAADRWQIAGTSHLASNGVEQRTGQVGKASAKIITAVGRTRGEELRLLVVVFGDLESYIRD